jgi:hypothetical protein
MAHEAQPCFLAWRFAKQSGIGIGSRGMRIIAPPFAVEIALAVAGLSGISCGGWA